MFSPLKDHDGDAYKLSEASDSSAHMDEYSVSDQSSSGSLDISTLSPSLGLDDDEKDWVVEGTPQKQVRTVSRPLDLFLQPPNTPQIRMPNTPQTPMDQMIIKKSKKRKFSMSMEKGAEECGSEESKNCKV